MARGAVAGYNRYLADQAGKLPAACNGQPWVKPMTLAEFRRQGELTAVQAATAALADAVLGAKPPAAAKSPQRRTEPVNLADAADAMREAGLLDSPLGSNAWAFGKDTTANGSGLLLGNPHFPVGRRQPLLAGAPDHPRQPGRDGRGHRQLSGCDHRLQQGRGLVAHRLHRQALHAARADAGRGDPTSLPDRRQTREDDSRTVSVPVRGADGSQQTKSATLWSTRWGPVVVLPRAGLNWTAKTAYALKDANLGNVRATDAALGFARARNVQDMREAMKNIGTPWVNTLAADRNGNTLYADVRWCPMSMRRNCSAARPASPPPRCCRPPGWWCWTARRAPATGSATPASPVPGLIPSGACPRHPDRLGAQQQRRLLLHPPGAEVERHLAAGR
jgi:acyl-homoserine-lactone acylase